MKKLMKSVIAVALVLSCCNCTVFANGTNERELVKLTSMESLVLDGSLIAVDDSLGQSRTTDSVFWNVSANTLKKANTTFAIDSGETVTINCAYTPKSAKVDFGLIDSDNRFYYIAGSQGSINCTIEIDKWDDYRFAVRNNSSNTVSVSGFIEY